MSKKLFKPLIAIFVLAIMSTAGRSAVYAQEEPQMIQHLVQPGDSWEAVSWRYRISEEILRSGSSHPNWQQQPSIGTYLSIPSAGVPERSGILRRSDDGGLLQTAAERSVGVWELALGNQITHPYLPLLTRPIFVSDEKSTPKDLPENFTDLELSNNPAAPGQVLAVRASIDGGESVDVLFAGQKMSLYQVEGNLIAMGGTGAFYPPGDHQLVIEQDGAPLWSQPWRINSGSWTFEEIYLTGDAAAISQEMILQERERLEAIWSTASPIPLWKDAFQLPLHEFLSYSSLYGARRSYNGGPYRSYHEGLDFSAYGGTTVYAPAAGHVVLAEQLDVRGNAVIVDHGLGLYSGFYHLSELHVAAGESVSAGQDLGAVGSTGLSTGNHLHWDLLINNTWIDPGDWIQSNRACWLSEGIGQPCP